MSWRWVKKDEDEFEMNFFWKRLRWVWDEWKNLKRDEDEFEMNLIWKGLRWVWDEQKSLIKDEDEFEMSFLETDWDTVKLSFNRSYLVSDEEYSVKAEFLLWYVQ